MNLGQPFGPHVEIAGGGGQRSVPQELLHDRDFHAVLQAVRSEPSAAESQRGSGGRKTNYRKTFTLPVN